MTITNLVMPHFTMAAAKASDRTQLVLVFFVWKALLFLLPAFCPGPGYDTSALVLTDASTNRHANIEFSSRFDRLVLNLFRWDALYFIRAAERGLVFEQEWAFSPAFSRLLSVTGQCEKTRVSSLAGIDTNIVISGNSQSSIQYYIIAGIIVSTTCHLLSVLVLYRLLTLVTGAGRQQIRIPFVASVLHILTPASLFLSAPYAECLFPILNLTGMLCDAESKAAAKPASISYQELAYNFSSGISFAVATTVRSNDLLTS